MVLLSFGCLGSNPETVSLILASTPSSMLAFVTDVDL